MFLPDLADDCITTIIECLHGKGVGNLVMTGCKRLICKLSKIPMMLCIDTPNDISTLTMCRQVDQSKIHIHSLSISVPLSPIDILGALRHLKKVVLSSENRCNVAQLPDSVEYIEYRYDDKDEIQAQKTTDSLYYGLSNQVASMPKHLKTLKIYVTNDQTFVYYYVLAAKILPDSITDLTLMGGNLKTATNGTYSCLLEAAYFPSSLTKLQTDILLAAMAVLSLPKSVTDLDCDSLCNIDVLSYLPLVKLTGTFRGTLRHPSKFPHLVHLDLSRIRSSVPLGLGIYMPPHVKYFAGSENITVLGGECRLDTLVWHGKRKNIDPYVYQYVKHIEIRLDGNLAKFLPTLPDCIEYMDLQWKKAGVVIYDFSRFTKCKTIKLRNYIAPADIPDSLTSFTMNCTVSTVFTGQRAPFAAHSINLQGAQLDKLRKLLDDARTYGYVPNIIEQLAHDDVNVDTN